jgi:hypothetical protein
VLDLLGRVKFVLGRGLETFPLFLPALVRMSSQVKQVIIILADE